MVNTGRPSPACKACRARRLKCDQTKPTCIKCAKAKRVCPGYREPFEVNFRDQTQSTIKKHQRSTPSASPRRSSDCSRNGDRLSFDQQDNDSSGPQTHPPPSLDTPSLQTPLEHRAKCFFYVNFIDVKISPRGGLKFLSPLVNSANEQSIFYSTFLATSMASLATKPNSSCLIPVARLYYNRALKKISKVVQDKENSLQDETLAAIIMLIFYESIMWEDSTPGGLISHIRGAQALARLRGPQQMHSPVGYAMFEFIRTFMVHQYVYVPNYDVDELKWWASEYATDEPGHNLQRLNVETTLLQRQIRQFIAAENDSSSSEKAFSIYRKAKKLDEQLRDWLREMSGVWERRTDCIQLDVPEEDIHRVESYPGKVYSFNNNWVGYHSLNAHIHRLKLAEARAQAVEWLQAHCSSDTISGLEQNEAAAIAYEQISEILAIIPFFLSGTYQKMPTPYSAMTCSFQLYVAGSSSFITRKQRNFIVGRLDTVAHTTGLKLARKFAQDLSKKAKQVTKNDNEGRKSS